MMSRLRTSVCVVALFVTAVACRDSTGPGSQAPATLDQALAELTIPALTAGVGLSVVGLTGPAPTLALATCPYSATVQSFVCTPISESGITLGQSFTLLSASGAKQSAFDPAATASIVVNATVGGTVVEQGASLTVNGQQELTLNGLVTGSHVLEGWSTIAITGTVTDETATYPVNFRVNTSIFNLVLPPNEAGSAQVWPSSGKITALVNGTFGPASVSQQTVIMFNGTSTVSVGVSSGLMSKTCKVDLAVAQPVCG